MGLFRFAKSLAEERASIENPNTSLYEVMQSIFGGGSEDQVHVNTRSAAGYPPVAKAVGMIAEDVAKLPLHVYRRDGEDRIRDRSHFAARIIGPRGMANEYTTTFDFWHDLMWDALLRGRGLAWIERDGPRAIGLYRLDPDAWRPRVVGGRKWWANYGDPPITLPDADILVVRGTQLDGLNPDDPIVLFRETLRVGISAQRFASNFFGNGAHVGGILQAPPGASETAIKNVEKAVAGKVSPDSWFKTLILRDGFRWQKTTVDPKDANLGETDEASARHVARIFRIPPSKLGLSDTVSYNSLDQEQRQYLDSTLAAWLLRIAGQCNAKLLVPSQFRTGNVYIEHLVDALQWTDAQTKASIATQGIQSGWLRPNEVRRWHNMPSLPEDEPDEPGEPSGGGDDAEDDGDE